MVYYKVYYESLLIYCVDKNSLLFLFLQIASIVIDINLQDHKFTFYKMLT